MDLQDGNGKPLIEDRHVTGYSNFEETLSGVKDQVPFKTGNQKQAEEGRSL